MMPFTINPSCIKCGHTDISIVWMSHIPQGTVNMVGQKMKYREEHLSCTCKVCGYFFEMEVATRELQD